MPAQETVTRSHVQLAAGPGAPPRQSAAWPATVVLDTNAVLDWLVFADGPMQVIGQAIAARKTQWLVTPRMLDELRTVMTRPLTPRWEPARELALTIDVMPWATVCPEPVPGTSLVCRDAADQVFVDLAREHHPTLLLTRDRALLALRRRAGCDGVEIETAAAWLASWRGR